jgi:hypothetical protein
MRRIKNIEIIVFENDLPFAKSSMACCVKIAPYKNKLFSCVNGSNREKFYIPKS